MKLSLLAAVLFSCTMLAMAASECRIDISADVAIKPVTAAAPAYARNIGWGPVEKRPKAIIVTAPQSNEWKELKFSIMPEGDGWMSIQLRGPMVKDPATNQMVAQSTCFDQFRIDGYPATNSGFEEDMRNWRLATVPNSKPAEIITDAAFVKFGQKCARTWHNGTLVCSISVKKGVKKEISFMYRDGGILK